MKWRLRWPGYFVGYCRLWVVVAGFPRTYGMFRSAARSLIHPESQSAPAGLSFCYDVHGFVLSTCRWKLDEDILLTLD
jgi:hypothetical protein